MITYKLSLSYVGTDFEGWQIQPEPRQTIQGTLNKCLKKIFKTDDIRTIGSGRTDAGVHALEQIVKLEAPFFIDPLGLVSALNSQLPIVIRVNYCETCPQDFMPTVDAFKKTYLYLLYEGEFLPPFWAGKATHIHVKSNVNWKAVAKALEVFVGSHDFENFSTKGTPVKSTVRKVLSADFESGSVEDFGGMKIRDNHLKIISFTGNGFLKQMVRLMVGSLIDVGKGKIQEQDIRDYLNEKKSDKLSAVAPASGLYLQKVFYPE